MEALKQKQNWISAFEKPLIISGPCSAESEDQVMQIAQELDKSYVQVYRAGIWKPRTKPGTFEGVGEIGLKWLSRVKNEIGMPVATEIANAEHAKLALKYDVDYLWIGARSTVSPFIVQEIAEVLNGTDKVVLVKNPINPDLDLWIGALERLAAQNIKNLGVIHRGFSTYKKTKYRNKPMWPLVLELRNRLPEIPILGDPSHICGNREDLLEVSQQAFNLQYQGLMIESHINPDKAWSDAQQQITPQRLLEILKELEIRQISDDNDSGYTSTIKTYRDEIDEIDQKILSNLLYRMNVATKVGELKKQHNVAVYQKDRWDSIMNKVVYDGKKLGLSEEFIRKVFETIHGESLEIQNKIMNHKE